VLAAAGLAGCGRKTAQGAIPRERFVLANAALRTVPDTAAAGDSLRRAALKRYHVTGADLQRFVRVHGTHADYMATVWREVADSVQKRYERIYLASRGGPRPPGMAPNVDGRLDSAPPARPAIVRPSGEPVVVPLPPRGVQPRDRARRRRPVPPPAATVPPVLPVRTPSARKPAPPTDRRPMTPPGADTLKRTPVP
jgi:hypothetical protein